jgi:transposase-like protein
MTNTTPSRFRIPEETRLRVVKMLLSGEYRCDVARALGVSEYSVTQIAKREGIKYAQCKRGTRWGKNQSDRVPVVTEPVQERNWAAEKANARWGAGFGA